MPNLQKIKVVINGKVQRIKVSTHAIKSGLVVKAGKRNWKPAAATAAQ